MANIESHNLTTSHGRTVAEPSKPAILNRSQKLSVKNVLRLLGVDTLYTVGLQYLDRIFDVLRSGRLRSLGWVISGDKSIAKSRQKYALASTVEYIEENLPHIRSSRNRKELLTQAFARADLSAGRLICEFGVFKADSINHLAALTDQSLYGFDSFEGLPNDQSDHWTKGRFSVDKLPKVNPNVTLIRGWFDETIPSFLREHPGDIAFLHVDSDLYSSAKTIFDLLGDRLKAGSVIVFDEYFNYPSWQEGEYRAFKEFLGTSGLGIDYIGYNRNGEQLALVLAAHEVSSTSTTVG